MLMYTCIESDQNRVSCEIWVHDCIPRARMTTIKLVTMLVELAFQVFEINSEQVPGFGHIAFVTALQVLCILHKALIASYLL
jgi:hypothetical protein